MYFGPVHDVFDAMDNENISTAKNAAQRAQTNVDYLKQDIEKLMMITEALWILLKHKNGYEDDVLNKIVEEIDMRDGRLDGKVAASEPLTCKACNRKTRKNSVRCMYCGAEIERDLFER